MPAKGGGIEVTPGTETTATQEPVSVRKRSVFRFSDSPRAQKTGLLGSDPDWLRGFKGQVTTESMGKLVCKVDGRDVPLTIGYHQVNVEIRDQIARTTIEQTFVNHTDVQLEGTFYFPLPQDASIAGFGMWINGELVEADVVEKQRAREIYETILRERRDPGLLEWTGGNLFKARVFPIFPNSEKTRQDHLHSGPAVSEWHGAVSLRAPERDAAADPAARTRHPGQPGERPCQ